MVNEPKEKSNVLKLPAPININMTLELASCVRSLQKVWEKSKIEAKELQERAKAIKEGKRKDDNALDM